MVINTTQGHTFTDSTAVTVNGETAEITERRADEMEIFVPFGTVTIDSSVLEADAIVNAGLENVEIIYE